MVERRASVTSADGCQPCPTRRRIPGPEAAVVIELGAIGPRLLRGEPDPEAATASPMSSMACGWSKSVPRLDVLVNNAGIGIAETEGITGPNTLLEFDTNAVGVAG